MSREKNLVKNTAILAIGTILPKLTAFIILPILTGYLTKTEYGIYDLLNTLISLLLPLISLKLEMAAFRFLIDCRDDRERSKKIISSCLCAVFSIAMVFFIAVFPLFQRREYAIYLYLLISLFFFLNILFSMLSQIARGLGHNIAYSVGAIINAAVNMILIVILVQRIQMSFKGLLIALDFALLLAVLFFAFFLKIQTFFSFSFFSGSLLKEMLAYSVPLIPNSLSVWIMELSDRLIVTAVLGIEVNAMYAIANKIPGLFNTLQGTFISAWHENASMSIQDSDSNEYYSYIFDAVFTLMIGIMAGLIALTPILFYVLIDPKYAEAYYQMPFLFGGMICFSLSSFMGGIYAAHKKTKAVGITTVFGAALNLLINLSLIGKIGVYAASISTLVSHFLLIVFRMIDIKKFQSMNYNIKKIVLNSFIIIGMCVLMSRNDLYLNIVNGLFGIIYALIINRTLINAILTGIKARLSESR